MLRTLAVLLTSVILTAPLLAACTPQSIPSTPAPKQTAAPVATAKAAWQQEWERTLAAARGEGKLIVLNEFGGDVNVTLAAQVKQQFGIEMEFVTGRVGEILAKVTMERRSGLYIEDVILAGITTTAQFRDPGFLDPLPPSFVLPEVSDSKAWMGGALRFIDKEQSILAYQVRASAPIIINTDLVKPDEIKSYKDLLNPKWKGKIVVLDPTMGAAGTNFFFILWEIMGEDFVRALGDQDLTVTRDGRLQGEWVSRGKHAISGNLSSDIQTQFMQAGAPIKVVQPVEGTVTSTAKSGLALINKRPHANAAKVLANWLLTKEGQIFMSKLTGDPSRRLDVPKDWVDPALLVQPDKKYIESDDEAAIKKKEQLREIAKGFWGIKPQ